MEDKIIEVKNLKVYFKVKKNIFSKVEYLKAVDDVSFEIFKGEKVGLIGESGCGKTTLGNAIIGLVPITSGDIFIDGLNTKVLRGNRKNLFKKVQFIFQDPYSSLNPRFKIYNILERPLINFYNMTKSERKNKLEEIIKFVSLDNESLKKYPHEFSGGQRQRIGIARALISDPVFLIADEPTSSLDVSVQGKILNLILDITIKSNLSLLFITHNLAVVNQFCDRIIVMYLGKIAEIASWKDLILNPLHYYTKALISAIPDKDSSIKIEDISLEGPLPSAINPPKGCRLNTRCKYTKKICYEEEPSILEIEKGHLVACHLYK